MAYNGFGVWSLVAQNLISSVITVVSFWFYVKWRPTWTFSRQSFRELFSFGFYMFLTHLINNFCRKIPGLLIGKVFSPITLGYYSKGIRTENLASHGISSVMTQVTYPLYAQVQDNKAVLSNMIRRLTMTISYITFPLMAALMLTAKPLFILLYSDRWVDSVPYFQIFCLVGLSDCLQSVNTQTIAAIGRSKIMLKWTLIKRTVGLSFIIGGLFGFGMKGLLAGMVIYNWFCYFVNIGLVSKYIGYKWKNQLSDLLPVTIVVFVSSLIAFIVAQVFHCSLYVDGLLKLIIFIAIYMSWSFFFKPESFTYSLTIIPNKLQFWKRF
jgi:O-antigen/teichoic acid export membrane protein